MAPSELENSDLLKNDDLNFDLVSKSLQFMTSSVDIDFTLPITKNSVINNNNTNNNNHDDNNNNNNDNTNNNKNDNTNHNHTHHHHPE